MITPSIFYSKMHTNLTSLFVDIKECYFNLNHDPSIKWVKIKIFFLDKNDYDKKYENYIYYKTKNTLSEDDFYKIFVDFCKTQKRNFPKDINNYHFVLIIQLKNK